MSDKNKNTKHSKNYYMSFGVGFGLMGGTLLSSVIGIMFESPYIWFIVPGVGTLIGIVIGAIMDSNKLKK